MKYKLLISLLIGIGFVGLVFATLDLTWIVGIALLMPGIALLGTFPYIPTLDSTPLPMLIANGLIYSLAAFVAVLIASRSLRPIACRKVAKITAVVVVAAVLIGWVSTRVLVSHGFGPCRNEATQYTSAPGGRYRAVVFYRNCGATSDFVTNVSIVKGLEVINHSETGNVFVASGRLAIQVHWTSQTHLMVTYPVGSQPSVTRPAYDGVTVDFLERVVGPSNDDR